jgi:hypothetical protein
MLRDSVRGIIDPSRKNDDATQLLHVRGAHPSQLRLMIGLRRKSVSDQRSRCVVEATGGCLRADV